MRVSGSTMRSRNARPVGNKHKTLTSGIEYQNAVLASRFVYPNAAVPERIEVLNQKRDRAVFRLPNIGPRGQSVIAKACIPPKSKTEHYFYAKILSNLGLTSAELYSYVEDGPGGWNWLLLEDVGRTRYRSTDPRHWEAASQWLAAFHVGVSHHVDPELVDIGAAQHLEYLESTIEALSAARSRDYGSSELRRVAERALEMCESIESRWDYIEALCDDAPQTLVHGDFQAKNVLVREQAAGLAIIPIDWGDSGRGPAAMCLGLLDVGKHQSVAGEQKYAAYHEIVCHHWPKFGVAHVAQLAVIGRLVWAVRALGWGLDALEWKPMDEAIADLNAYRHVLDDALSCADWYR